VKQFEVLKLPPPGFCSGDHPMICAKKIKVHVETVFVVVILPTPNKSYTELSN
jgi:hypothetical protein